MISGRRHDRRAPEGQGTGLGDDGLVEVETRGAAGGPRDESEPQAGSAVVTGAPGEAAVTGCGNPSAGSTLHSAQSVLEVCALWACSAGSIADSCCVVARLRIGFKHLTLGDCATAIARRFGRTPRRAGSSDGPRSPRRGSFLCAGCVRFTTLNSACRAFGKIADPPVGASVHNGLSYPHSRQDGVVRRYGSATGWGASSLVYCRVEQSPIVRSDLPLSVTADQDSSSTLRASRGRRHRGVEWPRSRRRRARLPDAPFTGVGADKVIAGLRADCANTAL